VWPDPTRGESQSERTRAGSKVKNTLPRFDPSVLFQPFEEALREPRPKTLVIVGPTAEIDDTILVISQYVTSA
jgi:hypothetical protein